MHSPKNKYFSPGVAFFTTLLFLLVFRIFFSMSKDIWSDDEKQIYLSGVKFFTSATLSPLGPDVVHTNQQIAGSLQSFLVGFPFFIAEFPISPLLFLNIISICALALIIWWVKPQLKNITPVSILLLLATLPWTLQISTHVYNPSYLLLPSCCFFIAFFESAPSLTTQRIKPMYRVFLLFFGLFFSMQLHLSWILLLPFLGYAIWQNSKHLNIVSLTLSSLLGALIPGIFLWSAINNYGLRSIISPLFSNSNDLHSFHVVNFFELLARYVSFGCYEITRFLGDSGQERLGFLLHHPLVLVPGALLIILGVVQVFWFIYQVYHHLFSLQNFEKYFAKLFVITFLIICFAFCFSSRPPTSRSYYILSPIMLTLSLLYADKWAATRLRQKILTVIIFTNIFYQGFSIYYARTPDSFMAKQEILGRALFTRNYHLIGERRYETAR